MSTTKMSTIKTTRLKSKLGMNQVRIHNDESEKGEVIRSLFMGIKRNETKLMED
jgi:hypothetical protein